MRDEFLTGEVPERYDNPDLAVLITTARRHVTCLLGPHPGQLLAPVPGLGPLLDDLIGDERNVLLTPARMVVTVETGQILPKDRPPG